MPETPSERVAVVVWWLAHGEGLTTRQVATLTGLSRQKAWVMLCNLSRVLPIYQDEKFVWQVCANREAA